MKLYYHPISTTSRPIMLFAAESGVPLDLQVVDLFTGEHVQAPLSERQALARPHEDAEELAAGVPSHRWLRSLAEAQGHGVRLN